MKPLVSIIIPTYNAERYLARALQSAIGQTYDELEIVVVDDGSKDETARIVAEYKDPRIVYLYQDNAGQGNARNRGLRVCKGEYVSFLDADDRYHPRKVEKQMAFLREHPGYKIVYCNALHVYAGAPGVLHKRRHVYRSGQVLPELLKSSYINPNTVLVARAVFEKCGGFVETRYYPEEWDLWLRMALAGFEFGYLDEDLVTVEVREGSNTTMEIQPILKRHAVEMLERLMPAPIEVAGTVYTKDRIVRNLRLKLAAACLANGRRREFLSAFTEALGGRSWAYVVGGLIMAMPRAMARRLWRINQLRNSSVVARR